MRIIATKNNRPNGIVRPKINPVLVDEVSSVGAVNTAATAVPIIVTPLDPILGEAANPSLIPLAIDPTSDESPTERVVRQLTDPAVTFFVNNFLLVNFFVGSIPLFACSSIQSRRASKKSMN